MSKELVIGSNRHETKVAILEEDQLVEIYFQRANEYSLAGSIHKGRVTRVLPGMQSAFVDLGLERDTFLYVSDFFEEHEDIDTVADDVGRPSGRGERRDRERQHIAKANERALEVNSPYAPPGGAEGGPEDAAVTFTALDGDETGDETEEIAGLADPAVTPEASGNRGDGGRLGDRRRRSRRRRNRGRGLPENKYVSPETPGHEAGQAPIDPDDRAESEQSATPEVSTASDVLILPGESLAKYRRAAPNFESSRGADEAGLNALPAGASGTSEVEGRVSTASWTPQSEGEAAAAEIGAIAAFAATEEEREALSLSDRVFAHNKSTYEGEAEGEESIGATSPANRSIGSSTPDVPTAPASFDSPASLQSVVMLDNAQPLATFGAHSSFGPHSASSEPLSRDEVAHDKSSPGSDVGEEIQGQEAGPQAIELHGHAMAELDDERRAEQAHLAAEEYESSFDSAESAVADKQAESAANLELESEPEASEWERAEGQVPQERPQTAVLRSDRDARPLQRSRRMRRRRGGSRFGNSVEPSLSVDSPPMPSASAGAAPAFEASERPERTYPSISDLLKPGQEIIVQIAKEPLGQKGARITSHVALPGRYVVFMPSVTHLGVSRKIASEEERQRLKRILQNHRSSASGGFIVRTAGEGVPEADIAADMNFLYSQWLDIRQKAEKKPAPALLHYDLDIVHRLLRDQVTEEFKAIWVDNEDLYENVLTFMQRFQPALVNRVKMYTRPAPIFDAFNITAELEKALRPKVWLKSGGYIVINQTEALVAIDINTGKFVGKSNRLEDTIVKTNTEAVKEIVRQIRLRDLGGIIVVDFIDMDERKNRQKVMAALEEAMRADKAPYKILQFNDFGLVAITRKRVKQSLERTLCAPCHYCDGAGYVKSVQTVIGEILVEAQKIARALDGKDVLLRANPEVAKTLKASSNHYLEELEEILGRPVLVKGDPTLHIEKFDLA